MDYDLIIIKILERISKNYYYIIRGVKIRKLQLLHRGYGIYYTSLGKQKYSKTTSKTYNLSSATPTKLQTVNTNGIDRYYATNGVGAVGGQLKVTYGGTNKNSQVTYTVELNVCVASGGFAR